MQGSAFAALAVLEAIASFAGTFLLNGVYSETVNATNPGITFAVASFVLLVCMGLMLLARPPPEPLASDDKTEASGLLVNATDE